MAHRDFRRAILPQIAGRHRQLFFDGQPKGKLRASCAEYAFATVFATFSLDFQW